MDDIDDVQRVVVFLSLLIGGICSALFLTAVLAISGG